MHVLFNVDHMYLIFECKKMIWVEMMSILLTISNISLSNSKTIENGEKHKKNVYFSKSSPRSMKIYFIVR
jgi:hypothetical protein